MRALGRVVTGGAALLIAASSVARAQPVVLLDHGLRFQITSRSFDTLQRVTALWGAATNGRFSADTFAVSFRLIGNIAWSMEQKQITQSVSFTIPLPANPRDSVGLIGVVRAGRRGVMGTDSVYGLRWFKRNWTGPLPPVVVDSFPTGYHVLAAYPWGFSDTTMLSGDSVYTPQGRISDKQSVVLVGRSYHFCELLQNKFTLVYSVAEPSDQPRCRTLLPIWAAERVPVPPGQLDTINTLTEPLTGALRAGIVGIDSQFGRMMIDRVDTTGRPFRVSLYTVYRNAYTDSARLAGAVVYAPHRCPRQPGGAWGGGGWDIRWNPAIFPAGNDASGGNLFKVPGDPNTVFPLSVAKAMVAQLPPDSLATLSRDSYAAYVRADTLWRNGRIWYEQCFGPLGSAP